MHSGNDLALYECQNSPPQSHQTQPFITVQKEGKGDTHGMGWRMENVRTDLIKSFEQSRFFATQKEGKGDTHGMGWRLESVRTYLIKSFEQSRFFATQKEGKGDSLNA